MRTIGVGNYPVDTVITHDGKHAYVANCDCQLSGNKRYTVWSVLLATGKILAKIPMPAAPYKLTLVDNDDFLYVSSAGGQPTQVIDTKTNSLVPPPLPLLGPELTIVNGAAYAVSQATGAVVARRTDLPASAGATNLGNIGAPPEEVDSPAKGNLAGGIAAANGHLYVASPTGHAIYSTVLSSGTVSWDKTYSIAGDTPYKLAVSRDGKRLYATTTMTPYLYLIDLGTKAVSRIQIPAAANQMIIDPTGRLLYLASDSTDTKNNSQDVYVVDLATASIGTISLGRAAGGLDITSDGKQLCIANPTSNSITVVDLDRMSPKKSTDRASLVKLPAFPSLPSDSAPNLAYGKQVEAPDVFPNSPWRPAYLTDGQRRSTVWDKGYTSDPVQRDPKSTESVVIDFGSDVSVGSVRLYPRTAVASDGETADMNGVDFPAAFVLEMSKDDKTWARVGGASSQSAGDEPRTYVLEPGAHGRYLRLRTTMLGRPDSVNDHGSRLQLAELEAYAP